MLIECPFCHAQANLPASKEGAKVRCPECGKVYLAREPGKRGTSSGLNPLHIVLGAVGLALALILVFALTRGSDEPVVTAKGTAQAPPEAAVPEDTTGWDSAPLKAVRAVYQLATPGNEAALGVRIDPERYAARLVEEHAAALAAGAASEGPAPRPWSELDTLERSELLSAAARGWLEGEGDTVAALWEPYDGRVVSEGDREAVVLVNVAGRSQERKAESRTIEWKLALHGGDWRVWSWARYVSPEELAAARSSRTREITRVELDDGTRLYQADPRPLPHLEDTPPELAARIDAAVLRMLDFSLRPRENSDAASELVAIGRPALPILLTAMHENRIVDDDTLAKAVKIHHTMRDITGYDPGFPVNALGPDSELKRDVAVRAWFAWWLRKGEERFEERVDGPDLLDTLIQGSEGG
jgi:hypothetical protein